MVDSVSDTHEVAGSSPALPTNTNTMDMYYSSNDKKEILANADIFGDPSAYIEIATQKQTVYAVCEVSLSNIAKVIGELARPLVNNGESVNVGIGNFDNGNENIMVNGSADSETIGKLKEANLDAITALTSAMINQILQFAFKTYH